MSFVHMLNLGDVFLRPLSVCFAGRVGRTSLELGQLKICERHGFNSRYLWKKTNDLLQPGSFNWFQRNWRMQKLEGEPCYGFSSLSVFVWLPFKWVALIFKTRKIIDLGEDLIQRLTFLVDAGLQPYRPCTSWVRTSQEAARNFPSIPHGLKPIKAIQIDDTHNFHGFLGKSVMIYVYLCFVLGYNPRNHVEFNKQWRCVS